MTIFKSGNNAVRGFLSRKKNSLKDATHAPSAYLHLYCKDKDYKYKFN